MVDNLEYHNHAFRGRSKFQDRFHFYVRHFFQKGVEDVQLPPTYARALPLFKEGLNDVPHLHFIPEAELMCIGVTYSLLNITAFVLKVHQTWVFKIKGKACVTNFRMLFGLQFQQCIQILAKLTLSYGDKWKLEP